ncbi:unknown [Azospirillum sp. CAG:239]|nr:unknown [Azospirillum sp. CAG:239]
MLDRGIYGCPERVAPEDDCNNNKNMPEDDYKEKVPTASENRYITVQKSYMTFDIHKFVYD